MKQLISLLLITLVTVVSWSSCAKNEGINETTNYGISYLVTSSSLLTPSKTDNSLRFSQAKVVNEHNRFFELSIIFNEKLQQMISLLSRSNDEQIDVAKNNVLSPPNKQLTVEACKES